MLRRIRFGEQRSIGVSVSTPRRVGKPTHPAQKSHHMYNLFFLTASSPKNTMIPAPFLQQTLFLFQQIPLPMGFPVLLVWHSLAPVPKCFQKSHGHPLPTINLFFTPWSRWSWGKLKWRLWKGSGKWEELQSLNEIYFLYIIIYTHILNLNYSQLYNIPCQTISLFSEVGCKSECGLKYFLKGQHFLYVHLGYSLL